MKPVEYILALELNHATEVGAIGAARAAGYGDKKRADREAVKAMRHSLNLVDFKGRVVIGEGEEVVEEMLQKRYKSSLTIEEVLDKMYNLVTDLALKT